MAIVTESTLATSEVFNGLNEMSGSNQIEKAINLIKTAKHLSVDDIEGAYIQIRQYPNSLSRAAVKAFEEGQVALVYNQIKSNSVSVALPFITFQTQGKTVTYVFVDNHVRLTKDGVLNIQYTVLHDLLVGALVANKLKTNYEALLSSQYLQKILMTVYTKFVIRVLNKEYQFAADKTSFDTIQFWVNKFFLLNIFGSKDSPDNIDKLSSDNVKSLDEMKLDDVKRLYNEKDPSSVTGLLELVKTGSARMNSLTLATFLSSWINYYFPISILAIDNVEYLIFMVFTLLRGTNLVSINAADIATETKNIKLLNEELIKLI